MTPHARRSRAARGWARISAAELGRELGRNKEYVDRRENGEYDYSPGDLRVIAAVTGAPLEFLQHGAGWAVGEWQADAKKAARDLERAAQARTKQSLGPSSSTAGEGS